MASEQDDGDYDKLERDRNREFQNKIDKDKSILMEKNASREKSKLPSVIKAVRLTDDPGDDGEEYRDEQT